MRLTNKDLASPNPYFFALAREKGSALARGAG